MTTAQNTAARRLATGLLVALFLTLLTITVGAPAEARSSGDPCTGRYGWPVKPFDQAHPIRGYFGDPRTVFSGPRSQRTILQGAGTFSFHQGIDIAAPDGSPVYAVAPGRVVRTEGQRVTVECGNGRSFQYWHIEPAVRVGQKAVTGRTVLGHILPKREHVHLTHLEHHEAVNPLTQGRLTPYFDNTSPRITAVSARGSKRSGRAGLVVGGSITFVAETADKPALRVPGRWAGFPVTPAKLTWRIERADGRVVLESRASRNVGVYVPRNDRFWSTFARGTHQNWPVFHGVKAPFVSGRYLFKLSAKPLDTRLLPNGAYELVVTASDASENSDAFSLEFTIDNGSDR